MEQVFITHSRHDAPILAHINQQIVQAGIQPIMYEYDVQHSQTAWQEIKESIEECSALFIVLSNNLTSSPHTQNWIGWEVGVACALEKRVWVFEELNRKASFPVPYFTDYVPYDLGSPELRQLITNVARSYNLDNQRGGLFGGALLGFGMGGPPGAIAGAILGAVIGSPDSPPFTKMLCYHLDCKTRFNLYVTMREFECPACRRMLRFSERQWSDGNIVLWPDPRNGELAYDHFGWPSDEHDIQLYRFPA